MFVLTALDIIWSMRSQLGIYNFSVLATFTLTKIRALNSLLETLTVFLTASRSTAVAATLVSIVTQMLLSWCCHNWIHISTSRSHWLRHTQLSIDVATKDRVLCFVKYLISWKRRRLLVCGQNCLLFGLEHELACHLRFVNHVLFMVKFRKVLVLSIVLRTHTLLLHNFRLKSQRISHKNLLLSCSSYNLMTFCPGIFATLASALRSTEPIVLKALAVEFEAARTGAIAVFWHIFWGFRRRCQNVEACSSSFSYVGSRIS